MSFSGAKTALVLSAYHCHVFQETLKFSDLQIYFDCFVENFINYDSNHLNVKTFSLISIVPNVLCFFLLGGRLRNLLPSHLLSVGAFAKQGVSCSIENASKVYILSLCWFLISILFRL